MKKPLSLSLVIPAYNESHHIRACLDAIAMQDVMPLEVIVVDNNSIDDTVAIAKEYGFVKIVKARRRGIVHARDAGFNAATGDIIGRIDADTLLPPNWVETVLNFYKVRANFNYAWTSEGYFHNIKCPTINSWILTQIAFRLNRVLLGHYALWGSTMAVPRVKWLAVRKQICKRNDIHEDLDIAIHLHELGMKITYDTSVKVAVEMRRVLTGKDKLWQYLLMWPTTLRVHQRKTWVLGWIGAATLYSLSPVLRLNEKVFNMDTTKLKMLFSFMHDL